MQSQLADNCSSSPPRPDRGALLRVAVRRHHLATGIACLALSGHLVSALAQTEGGPAVPSKAPTSGASQGAPPLAALLGAGAFLLIVDRPFDAEHLYRAVLAQDANNAAALDGLRRAKEAQRPTWTALGHTYVSTYDVKLFTYAGGPTFRTPYGRIRLWAGTGEFKNQIHPTNTRNPLAPLATTLPFDSLRKTTYNLILEPYYKKYEGYLFLSRAEYDKAPSRNLFEVKLSYVPDPARERYNVTVSRQDAFFQSETQQFFAPESIFFVESRQLIDTYGVSADHPLAPRVDLSPSFTHFEYFDGNRRNLAQAQLMYRILPKPKSAMPVWRTGLTYIWDNAAHIGVYYYTAQNFHTLSLTSDYLYLSGKLRYYLYASYPVGKVRGTGLGKQDPPSTFYGSVNYNLSDGLELWAKFTTISARRTTIDFTDFILGISQRF